MFEVDYACIEFNHIELAIDMHQVKNNNWRI